MQIKKVEQQLDYNVKVYFLTTDIVGILPRLQNKWPCRNKGVPFIGEDVRLAQKLMLDKLQETDMFFCIVI